MGLGNCWKLYGTAPLGHCPPPYARAATGAAAPRYFAAKGPRAWLGAMARPAAAPHSVG